jgi:hypothetical protein
MSDFSSDDDEPLSKKAKTRAGNTVVVKKTAKVVSVFSLGTYLCDSNFSTSLDIHTS